MSMLRQGSKRKSRVQKNPGLWHGDRGLPARAVSPSASARAALWTTRDFGLVADVTVIIKKAARPFSPFDRRAALKVSTQQVTVLLWGRDALTQITKIGCGKAAERTWRLRWRERGVQLSVTSGGGQHARRLHAQRLRREQQRHLLRLRRRGKLRHQ